MIRALLLAALALACVCLAAFIVPIMATEFRDGPIAVGALLVAVALIMGAQGLRTVFDSGMPRAARWVSAVGVWVMACVVVSPALAETVTVNGQPVVVFPWGPWVVAIAEMARDILVPVLTAALLAVVTKLYPLGRMFLSEALVERTLRKWFDYGINATAGATRDAKVSIPVGATVVANALQRGVDRADASAVSKWVMKEAGGEVEVARKLFRLLHLEEGADANAVVPKALEKAGVLPTAAGTPLAPDLAARG